MKREEEIARQADKYSDNSSNYAEWSDDGGWSETNDIDLIEKAFKEGVKWADKTMIEKACEYLKESLMDNRDNCGYAVVSSFDTITLDEFIEDFRKAMKG